MVLASLFKKLSFYGESDSNILKLMTSDSAMEFPKSLDGIFAYCSYDKQNETLYVARDRVGVIPLSYVKEKDPIELGTEQKSYERIWFASEALSGGLDIGFVKRQAQRDKQNSRMVLKFLPHFLLRSHDEPSSKHFFP